MQRTGPTVFCCVEGCGSKKYKSPALLFHPFPLENVAMLFMTDPFGIEVPIDTRQLWEMILLLERKATPSDRVCALHFQPSDYYRTDSKYLQLRYSAFPTLNLPQKIDSLKMCMVKGCKSSNKTTNKELFTATPKNQQKWALWMTRLGLTMWESKIVVCSDHFQEGFPSDFPYHPDFAPSLLLGTQSRDESQESVGNAEDPLSFIQPEFVDVDMVSNDDVTGIFEDSIKVEPIEVEGLVEVKQERMCPGNTFC